METLEGKPGTETGCPDSQGNITWSTFGTERSHRIRFDSLYPMTLDKRRISWHNPYTTIVCTVSLGVVRLHCTSNFKDLRSGEIRQGRQSWGLWVATPKVWAGGLGGRRGGCRGGRKGVVGVVDGS